MASFSVCIPNFNYAGYLKLAIASVLRQDHNDFEICIADNASTDNSVGVVKDFGNSRINLKENPSNLGFAGNLDAVSAIATKAYAILLSSDDEMNAGALHCYDQFIAMMNGASMVMTAACNRIDSNGNKIGYDGVKRSIWKESDLDNELTSKIGHKVYKVGAKELLGRCLRTFYGPFNFAATCYATSDYRKVGGYGGGRLMNPDKWFHWKLLTVVEHAYFIDAPLFNYRVHSSNQNALQKSSGIIKYFLDEYRNAFEFSPEALKGTGLTAGQVEDLFIHNVIHKHVFRHIRHGDRSFAKRIYYFGWSTYPSAMKSKGMTYLLRTLLFLGVPGTWMAKLGKKNF